MLKALGRSAGIKALAELRALTKEAKAAEKEKLNGFFSKVFDKI